MGLALRLTAYLVIACAGVGPIFIGILEGNQWGAAGALAGLLLGLAAGILLAGIAGSATGAVRTRLRRPSRS